VQIEPLSVPGGFVFRPAVFDDDRGSFQEWYRHDALEEAAGHRLELAQANWSTSRRGVVRGLHYADVPPGQAKYVVCVRGAVLDVVADLRVGSPAFGEHAAVTLGENERAAVYLAEGLGHAFCALTDDATVLYLCSTTYNPAAEHGVHPLDADLRLPWPAEAGLVLSPKDAAAPSLAQALADGALPRFQDCQRWYQRLRPEGAER
jgi:dTDP-4-dehydrorhamnose 3,5-epimerase